MIADQNFYDICFTFFYPTASATAYGRRPKFVRAEHSATAEGENCAYDPTLDKSILHLLKHFFLFLGCAVLRLLLLLYFSYLHQVLKLHKFH